MGIRSNKPFSHFGNKTISAIAPSPGVGEHFPEHGVVSSPTRVKSMNIKDPKSGSSIK